MRTSAAAATDERSLEFAAMGGTVRLHVRCDADQADRVDRDLRLAAARIGAWARRLTRFDAGSDLSALNRRPAAPVTAVRPILGTVLRRSCSIAERTEGIVDVGMLGARLAAEDGDEPPPGPAGWALCDQGRGALVRREGPVRFDLDGVGKGWIADRALGLLSGYPAALVDADGDIAVRPPVMGRRGSWRSPTLATGTGCWPPWRSLREWGWAASASPPRAPLSTAGSTPGSIATTSSTRARADRPARTSCRPRSWPSPRWLPN